MLSRGCMWWEIEIPSWVLPYVFHVYFHFLHCQSLLWNFFWGVTNQFLLFGVAKHLQWNVFLPLVQGYRKWCPTYCVWISLPKQYGKCFHLRKMKTVENVDMEQMDIIIPPKPFSFTEDATRSFSTMFYFQGDFIFCRNWKQKISLFLWFQFLFIGTVTHFSQGNVFLPYVEDCNKGSRCSTYPV